MKLFPKCLKYQCWKQLKMLNAKAKGMDGIRPRIEPLHIFIIKHRLCAGCFSNDFILEAYCRDSFARLAPKQGSCAST